MLRLEPGFSRFPEIKKGPRSGKSFADPPRRQNARLALAQQDGYESHIEHPINGQCHHSENELFHVYAPFYRLTVERSCPWAYYRPALKPVIIDPWGFGLSAA